MGHDAGDGLWGELELGGIDRRAGINPPDGPLGQAEHEIPPHAWLAGNGEPSNWPGWVQPRADAPTSERIEWAWGDVVADKQMRKPSADTRGALDAFLRIGDTPTDGTGRRVLSFVKRWGPLGLCSAHGEPAAHSELCNAELTRQLNDPTWAGAERISDWLPLVDRARAVVRVSHELHSGNPVSRDSWARVANPQQTWAPQLATQKFWIGVLVSEWLREARVRPVLWWGGHKNVPPTVQLSNPTIFSVVTRQLAFAIASNTLIPFAEQLCTNCGRPISRDRKARRGYRTFCDQDECQLAKWRLAKRDQRRGVSRYRRTNRGEGSTHG